MFADIRLLQELVCDTPYDSTTYTGNIYCNFNRDNTVSSVRFICTLLSYEQLPFSTASGIFFTHLSSLPYLKLINFSRQTEWPAYTGTFSVTYDPFGDGAVICSLFACPHVVLPAS